MFLITHDDVLLAPSEGSEQPQQSFAHSDQSIRCQHPNKNINEPRCEKTGLRGFRPGPTQTGLYSHRRWLEA